MKKTLEEIFNELPYQIRNSCPESIVIVSLFRMEEEEADAKATIQSFNISEEQATRLFQELGQGHKINSLN